MPDTEHAPKKAGRLDLAAATLEKALHLGFRELTWLAKDPDLRNLRKHPRYEALQAKIRKMQAAQSLPRRA